MFSDTLLKDQVVIVTGGGTGIGLAIAKRFGELGARVAIGSRKSENLEKGSAALRHAGIDPLAVQVDVRNPEQVDEMVARVVRHFGRIDILINNAAGNFIARAEELSPNGWNAVIGIVLNGSFYCSRAVGRHMIARGGGGAIVSILANYVWTGSAGTIHSAAAKAGVMSMTQTLAVEWAKHQIRVNAVAPGPVESPGAAQQLWNTLEFIGAQLSQAQRDQVWEKYMDAVRHTAVLRERRERSCPRVLRQPVKSWPRKTNQRSRTGQVEIKVVRV